MGESSRRAGSCAFFRSYKRANDVRPPAKLLEWLSPPPQLIREVTTRKSNAGLYKERRFHIGRPIARKCHLLMVCQGIPNHGRFVDPHFRREEGCSGWPLDDKPVSLPDLARVGMYGGLYTQFS